ncbi:unnamed protein product [Polarella glacialis]|nr:unnamed protein product [Polarella glacialis]
MNKNPGSRISGFDIDIDGVQLAQSLLSQPSAISWPLSPAALGPEQQRQQRQKRQKQRQQQQQQGQQQQQQQLQQQLPLQAPSVFRADLLKLGFGLEADARQELLPEGSFQVVNLGMAVLGEESEAFSVLTRLLAEGGCLTVPVCVRPVCVDGKCSADFRLYRRRGDTLIQEAGGYTVSFIAPLDQPKAGKQYTPLLGSRSPSVGAEI